MSDLIVMQARAAADERERELAARLAAREQGRDAPDAPAGWWTALRERVVRPRQQLRPSA